MNLLILFKIPIDFEILFFMYAMWSDQFNLLLIIILIHIQCISSFKTISLCLVRYIIYDMIKSITIFVLLLLSLSIQCIYLVI